MARRNVTYGQLVEQLTAIGVDENERTCGIRSVGGGSP
jgi:Domain of unknown function (DUF6471)